MGQVKPLLHQNPLMPSLLTQKKRQNSGHDFKVIHSLAAPCLSAPAFPVSLLGHQGCSHPRAFALTVLSAWTALFPGTCMTHFSSFVPLLDCQLLDKALPDYTVSDCPKHPHTSQSLSHSTYHYLTYFKILSAVCLQERRDIFPAFFPPTALSPVTST